MEEIPVEKAKADFTKDAVALANSSLAVKQRPENVKMTGRGIVPYKNIRYQPTKDKWLRSVADDTLEQHKEVLAVREPTCTECGGLVTGLDPNGKNGIERKCVDGLPWERVLELTAHMKPLGAVSGNGSHRRRKDIASIRETQAGRMEYELNRLRLLRERRIRLLMSFDADRDGRFNQSEVEAVLDRLYGDATGAPKGATLEELLGKLMEVCLVTLSSPSRLHPPAPRLPNAPQPCSPAGPTPPLHRPAAPPLSACDPCSTSDGRARRKLVVPFYSRRGRWCHWHSTTYDGAT